MTNLDRPSVAGFPQLLDGAGSHCPSCGLPRILSVAYTENAAVGLRLCSESHTTTVAATSPEWHRDER